MQDTENTQIRKTRPKEQSARNKNGGGNLYISYAEYTAYGGELTETAFDGLIWECQAKVDYYTFFRLKKDTEYSERVKVACSKIIDILYRRKEYVSRVTDLGNPVVVSGSNDGVSETYGGIISHSAPSDIVAYNQQIEKEIYDTIRFYLAGEVNQNGIELLYRGV